MVLLEKANTASSSYTTEVLCHLPRVLVYIIGSDGSEYHHLGAAALEQGDLVLGAEAGERRQLLRHLNQPADGDVRHVDDVN